MEKLKLALIGGGSMANRVHYPSLAEMPDVHLAALCDVAPQARDQTAARFGIANTYSDYREMVEKEDPDAVYILMSPQYLYDLVIHCLERGKHVFIEKPPGISTFQAESMARMAARYNCLTMVAFNRRFCPVFRQTLERQREAGELNLAVSTFYKAQADAVYGRGAIDVLHCDAIHAVDALRWMGGEVASVASHVGSSRSELRNRFIAVTEFDSGATGVLLTNWAAGGRVHTFELHAPDFSAFVNPDAGGQTTIITRGKIEQVASEEAAGSAEWHKVYGFFGENRHFIDCLKRGVQPESNFADAARSMRLADEVLNYSI